MENTIFQDTKVNDTEQDFEEMILSLDEILEKAQIDRPADLSTEHIATALRAIAW